MQITLELPDEIARQFGASRPGPPGFPSAFGTTQVVPSLEDALRVGCGADLLVCLPDSRDQVEEGRPGGPPHGSRGRYEPFG